MKFWIPFAFLSCSVFADYAWIPRTETLSLRVGVQHFQSGDNIDTDGARTDIVYLNRIVSFKEFRLSAETEYAFSSRWSGFGKLNFISNSVSDSTGTAGTLASGSGFGDFVWGFKHVLLESTPALVFETRIKIPMYTATVRTNDELVRGDGNFDLGLFVHGGHRSGLLFGALSPGFILRSGGYASALAVEAAAGVRAKQGYGLLFFDFQSAISEVEHLDSRIDRHDAPGSGGTYARLSGSPTTFRVGMRGGARAAGNTYIELSLSQLLGGRRAPYGFAIGLSVMTLFDLHKPDTRTKIKQVPFNSGEEKLENDGFEF